jgi:hypothetical protein
MANLNQAVFRAMGEGERFKEDGIQVHFNCAQVTLLGSATDPNRVIDR